MVSRYNQAKGERIVESKLPIVVVAAVVAVLAMLVSRGLSESNRTNSMSTRNQDESHNTARAYSDSGYSLAPLSQDQIQKLAEKLTPGPCGGDPLPDGGACPPNCSATLCPQGDLVCLCLTYTCKPLPTGCSDCSCLLSSNPGCTCSASGGIYLGCFLP